MKNRICIYCKKRLPLSKFYRSQRDGHGYGCKECLSLYNKQIYKKIKEKKQREATKKCKFCEKTVKDEKRDFCSNSCARKYDFRIKKIKRRGDYSKIVRCGTCGIKISRRPSVLKKINYCSHECRMKGQNNKNTDIEKQMEIILNQTKLKYINQYVFPKICIADFFLPEYKLAIFCDGEYWHNYPHGKKRDKKQVKKLKEIKINAIRLWSRQILKENPLKYLKKFLQ